MGAVEPVPVDRPLTIRVERREGTAVVTLEGACTMEVSSQIRHCLVGLAAEMVPVVILDLSGLDFIDSIGLGGIVAAHLKGRHHHGMIRLVNPQPAIRELLDVTQLTRRFPIDSSVEEALSATRG